LMGIAALAAVMLVGAGLWLGVRSRGGSIAATVAAEPLASPFLATPAPKPLAPSPPPTAAPTQPAATMPGTGWVGSSQAVGPKLAIPC